MNWRNLSQTWHYVEKWAEARPAAEAMVFGDERVTRDGFKKEMDHAAGNQMIFPGL